MFTGKGRMLAVAVAAVSIGGGLAQAQEALRVTGGEVTVVCPLTVGGSFEAKTNAVTGEVRPVEQAGTAVGALQVKLDTLQTGIALRDRHMRSNYLEVEKGGEYATAMLENIRVEKFDGKGTFRGDLTLHGQRREVVGTSAVQRKDGGVRVEAEFPVRVSEFGIAEPTYLGVGVRDEVQVKVKLTARPATTDAAKR
jgi:polyisoprenoid-binding protein YceI